MASYRPDDVLDRAREIGWLKEVVLALDGGGVRGESSLLILKAIMDEVSRIEHAPFDAECLASEYFDFMFGTSTGGLIAIMLSRLRMGTGMALDEYRELAGAVFKRRRFWRFAQYSSNNFKHILQEVIRRHSPEHRGNILMDEPDSAGGRSRAGVFAVRRSKPHADQSYIFRTYPTTEAHRNREAHGLKLLNPDGQGQVYLWEAALATTAAPHFFKDVEINGIRFMDGGVKTNNPSLKAWYEANVCHQSRSTDHLRDNDSRIVLFISIGTGKGAPFCMFNEHNIVRHILQIARAAFKKLTDTSDTHEAMCAATAGRTLYYRFNVDEGLEDVGMDQGDSKTLGRIDAATGRYLQKPEVKKWVHECAAVLVECRQARSGEADRNHDEYGPFGRGNRPAPSSHGSINQRRANFSHSRTWACPESSNANTGRIFDQRQPRRGFFDSERSNRSGATSTAELPVQDLSPSFWMSELHNFREDPVEAGSSDVFDNMIRPRHESGTFPLTAAQSHTPRL